MPDTPLTYMDHAATTPLDPAVLAAMTPFLTNHFGNPSSPHQVGRTALNALDQARDTVATVVGCSNSEIIFTAGGSEGNNLAIKGAALAHLHSHGSAHVIVSAIEHHAVLHAAEALTRHGIAVTVLPVDHDGVVDPDTLRAALRPDTAVVSIMYANNEIGTIQPIAALARICRDHGTLMHTDAVQAAGTLPIDLATLGVDMLTITAHKFYGPKGVGVNVVRRGVELFPLIHGGAQERRRRAGTENVAGIVGLAHALHQAHTHRDAEVARLTPLRDALIDGICAELTNVRTTGHLHQRLANNASFIIDGIDGDSLLIMLDQRGICASSGSACTSGSMEPSHVLGAIAATGTHEQAALRLSLGHSSDMAAVERTIAAVVAIVQRLRA